MDFGGIFDFGGEESGDRPMQTVEEQGGYLDWLTGGGLPETAKSTIAGAAQDAFIRKSLAEALNGPDAFGQDLIEYKPPSEGWLSGFALTEGGKKWALILGAAAVGFYLVKGRR